MHLLLIAALVLVAIPASGNAQEDERPRRPPSLAPT